MGIYNGDKDANHNYQKDDRINSSGVFNLALICNNIKIYSTNDMMRSGWLSM